MNSERYIYVMNWVLYGVQWKAYLYFEFKTKQWTVYGVFMLWIVHYTVKSLRYIYDTECALCSE